MIQCHLMNCVWQFNAGPLISDMASLAFEIVAPGLQDVQHFNNDQYIGSEGCIKLIGANKS